MTQHVWKCLRRGMLHAGKDDRGQVLMLWALVIVVAIGFAGLSLDVGVLYLKRNHLQNAADAAALAGAQSLAQSQTAYTGVAETVGGTDGASLQDFSYPHDGVTLNRADNTVKVTVTQPSSVFFMRLFGFQSFPIVVSAAAKIGTSPAFQYAVFTSESMSINSGWTDIQGSIHSNGSITINGSQNGMHVSGSCEASGSSSYGYGFQCGKIINGAPTIPMPVYPPSSILAQATTVVDSSNWSTYFPSSLGWSWSSGVLTFHGSSSGQGATINGNYDIQGGLTINGNSATESGTLYVEGNVQIDPSSYDGSGTLYATGSIAISTSNMTQSSTGQLAVYSSSTASAIQLSFSSGNFNGTLYAPNGAVSLSASSNTVYGSIVAKSFSGSAGATHVVYEPSSGQAFQTGGQARLVS